MCSSKLCIVRKCLSAADGIVDGLRDKSVDVELYIATRCCHLFTQFLTPASPGQTVRDVRSSVFLVSSRNHVPAMALVGCYRLNKSSWCEELGQGLPRV